MIEPGRSIIWIIGRSEVGGLGERARLGCEDKSCDRGARGLSEVSPGEKAIDAYRKVEEAEEVRKSDG